MRTILGEAIKKRDRTPTVENETYFKSQCFYCNQMSANGCPAFEEGIPLAILNNLHDHSNPYDGDNGIMFEKSDKFKDQNITIMSLNGTFPPIKWVV